MNPMTSIDAVAMTTIAAAVAVTIDATKVVTENTIKVKAASAATTWHLTPTSRKRIQTTKPMVGANKMQRRALQMVISFGMASSGFPDSARKLTSILCKST